jgi:peptide methionine sulfoxide reductase msrA/msrB
MTTFGIDQNYQPTVGTAVIYLAGGCFWGLEKLMQSLPGVIDVVSGYANGRADVSPTYKLVCTSTTGYRETVRVVYQPERISLDALLFAYFQVIDPTVANRQGNDVGTQYQTGVYYPDENARATVERIVSLEKERSPKFMVEVGALERFYEAEEYHQNYLDKNPNGYCHISRNEMRAVSAMLVDPGKYQRPAAEQIRAQLDEMQFKATQLGGTERAFSHPYYENKARGIYVDVVTGEPLFSSTDKFLSGTGWPSFTKPIDVNTLREVEDNSHGMRRVEVRSRAGNSHLGHVFFNDPVSPNGVRYCVNGSSLRFVPYEEMEAKGYGYLMAYVK